MGWIEEGLSLRMVGEGERACESWLGFTDADIEIRGVDGAYWILTNLKLVSAREGGPRQ